MSVLKTGPYSVDACGDYYDRPVWERDLLVRGGVYGLTDIVPRDELLARCGSLGYKLTVMLFDAGVQFSDMYDLGVLAWGVFPNDMYDDAWVLRVNGRLYAVGGVYGVIERLRGLGVDSGGLEKIMIETMQETGAESGAPLELKLKITDWDETYWGKEVIELLADAKLEGAKGFNVRRDLLVLIGKNKGFIKDDTSGIDGLAAFILSINNKAAALAGSIEDRIKDAEYEVIDSGKEES